MWNFQNLTLCSWRDLNPGPRARDPNALPTELSRLNEIWAVKWNFYKCYTKIFKRKVVYRGAKRNVRLEVGVCGWVGPWHSSRSLKLSSVETGQCSDG